MQLYPLKCSVEAYNCVINIYSRHLLWTLCRCNPIKWCKIIFCILQKQEQQKRLKPLFTETQHYDVSRIQSSLTFPFDVCFLLPIQLTWKCSTLFPVFHRRFYTQKMHLHKIRGAMAAAAGVRRSFFEGFSISYDSSAMNVLSNFNILKFNSLKLREVNDCSVLLQPHINIYCLP